MKRHVAVFVREKPTCDVDADHGEAYADARVPPSGPWGFLCRDCFDRFGCELGLGRGQRLVTKR